MAGAALAAHKHHHVVTIESKEAEMKGIPVDMLLAPDIAEVLVGHLRSAYVRTRKSRFALGGFKQSAMLWYQELASALEQLGFKRNAYDICSFTRVRGKSTDRILVSVDD